MKVFKGTRPYQALLSNHTVLSWLFDSKGEKIKKERLVSELENIDFYFGLIEPGDVGTRHQEGLLFRSEKIKAEIKNFDSDFVQVMAINNIKILEAIG